MHVLEEEDYAPRVQFRRNGSLCFATPFSRALFLDSYPRRSLSYDKLPQEPLKLTVLKLDGSLFDIAIAKMGTVAELKQAVEAAFSHLPKRGPGKVSWPHLWGHFCLSYDGHKLLTDSDYLGSYGIKDGDQLRFVRHVSIRYNLIKAQSEKEDLELEEPRISSSSEDRRQSSEKDENSCQEDLEQQLHVDHDENDDIDDGVITHCQFSLTHLLRGWFSYRKLDSSEMRIQKGCCLGSFKSLLQFYSQRYDAQRESWKAK